MPGLTPAPPTLRATRSACPPVSAAKSSSDISVAVWVIGSTMRQSPPGPRPPKTAIAPVFSRTIAGVGRAANRLGPAPVDEARLHSDQMSGANQVEFIGRTILKREFAGQLRRIGADPVVGGDAAEGAEAGVEKDGLLRGAGCLVHHQKLAARRLRQKTRIR